MKPWIELAKHQKMAWVECTDRGDLPPTVVAIREGKPVIIAIAPQVDKHLALHAAQCCRAGFAADELVVILDAHTVLYRGKSEEERMRLLEKYSVAGAMQNACDEEGACEKREIADCIIINHISKDGKYAIDTLPYDYHGKDGGVEFSWMDEHNESMSDDEAEAEIQGFIPDNLREIIASSILIDREDFKSGAEHFGFGIAEYFQDREKALWHMAIAMRKFLERQDFLLMDCISFDGTKEDFEKATRAKLEEVKRAESLNSTLNSEMN